MYGGVGGRTKEQRERESEYVYGKCGLKPVFWVLRSCVWVCVGVKERETEWKRVFTRQMQL